jgi:hypothetical protein
MNMDVFWSLLLIIIGVGVIFHSYKEREPAKDNVWDIVMTYRGYVGGILFIVIGIVTLIKGW